MEVPYEFSGMPKSPQMPPDIVIEVEEVTVAFRLMGSKLQVILGTELVMAATRSYIE
jgi:hypothetical protein